MREACKQKLRKWKFLKYQKSHLPNAFPNCTKSVEKKNEKKFFFFF